MKKMILALGASAALCMMAATPAFAANNGAAISIGNAKGMTMTTTSATAIGNAAGNVSSSLGTASSDATFAAGDVSKSAVSTGLNAPLSSDINSLVITTDSAAAGSTLANSGLVTDSR